MAKKQKPRLRTADKISAPYRLNDFPKDFHISVGKEIVFILATKGVASIEGPEWERIFATSINADWKPSNIGLDDVVLGNTAWGAKTVKSAVKDFRNLNKIRLISGRNSPVFSYGDTVDVTHDPNEVGEKVLEIWNDRVISVRSRFENLRTVVLIKSDDLSQVAIYEFDTIMYVPQAFNFKWNKRNNLEGFDKVTGEKTFTWQPHGSQFTIHEHIPNNILILKIKTPEIIDKSTILNATGFDSSWVTIINK
jgi:hypothetical protein